MGLYGNRILLSNEFSDYFDFRPKKGMIAAIENKYLRNATIEFLKEYTPRYT